MENWKPIKNYEDLYVVSNYGRIISLKRNIVMKTRLDKNGYEIIGLSKNGEQKTFKVHRLVGQAFCSNPNNHNEIDHLNKIKNDNRAVNLEWVTQETNLQRRDLSNMEIGICQYDLKDNFIKSYKSLREASRVTGIAHPNISGCINGTRRTAGKYKWRKIEEEI